MAPVLQNSSDVYLHTEDSDITDEESPNIPLDVFIAPDAPPPPVFLAVATHSSGRSASVSAASGGTASRLGLLQSIQAGTTLRRRSEYTPLRSPAIVVDLNTELHWAMRKKGLMDESKEAASVVRQQMTEDANAALAALTHRLHHLGLSAAHPATPESIDTVLAECDQFVKESSTDAETETQTTAIWWFCIFF